MSASDWKMKIRPREGQDQDVAREHVGKGLTLSEIGRMNWPRISGGTINASNGFSASGSSS
jgi:hypothetical protein